MTGLEQKVRHFLNFEVNYVEETTRAKCLLTESLYRCARLGHCDISCCCYCCEQLGRRLGSYSLSYEWRRMFGDLICHMLGTFGCTQ